MGLGWSSASLCLAGAVTAQTRRKSIGDSGTELVLWKRPPSFSPQELWLLLRAGGIWHTLGGLCFHLGPLQTPAEGLRVEEWAPVYWVLGAQAARG